MTLPRVTAHLAILRSKLNARRSAPDQMDIMIVSWCEMHVEG